MRSGTCRPGCLVDADLEKVNVIYMEAIARLQPASGARGSRSGNELRVANRNPSSLELLKSICFRLLPAEDLPMMAHDEQQVQPQLRRTSRCRAGIRGKSPAPFSRYIDRPPDKIRALGGSANLVFPGYAACYRRKRMCSDVEPGGRSQAFLRRGFRRFLMRRLCDGVRRLGHEMCNTTPRRNMYSVKASHRALLPIERMDIEDAEIGGRGKTWSCA